jgi:hypothetical protein
VLKKFNNCDITASGKSQLVQEKSVVFEEIQILQTSLLFKPALSNMRVFALTSALLFKTI